MKIRIGTRKSALALAQTRLVENALKAAFPEIETEIVHITTKGDKILDKPLDAIGGKGVFIAEIERALTENEIDIAVHSAKDLPLELAEGTHIGAVPERADPADVLVMRRGDSIADVMTVGTGSLRRRNAFSSIFAGRVFNDIRGNVDTRLKKLENGEYDGIILAAAGLERLGLRSSERFSYMEFEPEFFVPAPCQGIIAVQSRIGETDELLAAINHPETFLCFQTEREVLRLLDAGCTTPVGAYARRSGERLTLTITLDSMSLVTCECTDDNYEKLVREAVGSL